PIPRIGITRSGQNTPAIEANKRLGHDDSRIEVLVDDIGSRESEGLTENTPLLSRANGRSYSGNGSTSASYQNGGHPHDGSWTEEGPSSGGHIPPKFRGKKVYIPV